MSFNVLEFITGASYPKDKTHIYLDGESASRRSQLLKEPESKARDKEIDALEKKIAETAITVELQGFPEHVRRTILRQAENEAEEKGLTGNDKSEYGLYSLLASTVVSVSSPSGEKDTTEMTPERLFDIYKEVPSGGMDEFFKKANALAIDSLEFEGSADQDF